MYMYVVLLLTLSFLRVSHSRKQPFSLAKSNLYFTVEWNTYMFLKEKKKVEHTCGYVENSTWEVRFSSKA